MKSPVPDDHLEQRQDAMTIVKGWPDVARAAAVALSSLLLGALTFVAQGWLPDAVSSFANSASGWTLVTVSLLTVVGAGPAAAALLGATSFVLLTVGYAAAAQLQGLSYDPTLFAVVGAVVGPFVGVATSWLRAVPSWRRALGTALLAGIGVGEASYGLTTVAETTSPVYWWLIGALALSLLGTMLLYRIQGMWRPISLLGTCLTAAAFLWAYGGLGGI